MWYGLYFVLAVGLVSATGCVPLTVTFDHAEDDQLARVQLLSTRALDATTATEICSYFVKR